MHSRPFPRALRRLAAAAGLATALAASAQAPALPPPQGVLNLSAGASVEVTKDVLVVTFATTREGPDATGVQNELKRALDAALAEAKRVAQPQQVEVSTGNFSLYPRYAPKGGTIAGWVGRAELVVQGRDMATIGALSGRITTMSVAGVGHRLSREAQRQVEAEVTAQAIARFRALAGELSKQFGYAGYTLREVSVNTSGDGDHPMPVMRAGGMVAAADAAPLPVEPGKGSVSASVNGSVQMQ
ncbi:MAG: SIMPL domain-containing protein [Burkholderiaceae bacterium]|nr:SIMPL domain-containing protein [Burkholderiaceae bacterium]